MRQAEMAARDRREADGARDRLSAIGAAQSGGVPPRRPRRLKPIHAVDLDHNAAGWVGSVLVHLLVLVVTLLGLPHLFEHKPLEDQPIAVTLVNPSDLTRATQRNPKPVKDAKLDAPPPLTPEVKPEPPKPETPPTPAPPPPQSAKNEPPPTPAPPQPPKPEDKPPPPPPPLPEPKPAPTPEPPKLQEKPEPPKPEAKPEPPKLPDKPKPKQPDQDFDQLLKNLSKQASTLQKSDQPPKKPQTASTSAASAQPNAPLGSQLTTNELDLLRQQIEDCWNPPAGAKDAGDLKVQVHIEVAQDGTITSARIVDDGLYDSNPFYRAAADAARRAALNPRCQKLHVPASKYDQWKSINLYFDPKDQLS